jgi:hypothetical protein
MSLESVGQLAAIAAVACGGGGLVFESTPMVVAGTALAVVSAMAWVRSTAPHDHWKEMRKRKD